MRVLILTTLMLFVVMLPAQSNADEWRVKECRFGDLRAGATWTTYEVERTIRCATSKWTVPGGTTQAFNVARCEAGDDLLDYSHDGYAGTYQHSTEFWQARFHNLKPPAWDMAPSVYNPRSNVVIAIRLARGGWTPWSCA